MADTPTRPFVRRAWIVFPAVVLTALDGGLTLFGQPLAYWAGEFSAAHEFSPLGAAFLRLHPSAFAALMLVWIGVIVVAGLLLREPWGHIWSLMIVIGHTAGSFDWLEDFDYFGALFLFFAASFLTVFCWRRAGSFIARGPAGAGAAPEAAP